VSHKAAAGVQLRPVRVAAARLRADGLRHQVQRCVSTVRGDAVQPHSRGRPLPPLLQGTTCTQQQTGARAGETRSAHHRVHIQVARSIGRQEGSKRSMHPLPGRNCYCGAAELLASVHCDVQRDTSRLLLQLQRLLSGPCAPGCTQDSFQHG
jgi:hypothetical protein